MPEQASYRPRVIRRGGRGGGGGGGGGYRYGAADDYRGGRGGGGPGDSRVEKDVSEIEGRNYDQRERPMRYRYPRFKNPVGRGGRGGYYGGGGGGGGGGGRRGGGGVHSESNGYRSEGNEDGGGGDHRQVSGNEAGGGQGHQAQQREGRPQRNRPRRRPRPGQNRGGGRDRDTGADKSGADSARDYSTADDHDTDGGGNALTDGDGEQKKSVKRSERRGGGGRKSKPRAPGGRNRKRARLPKVFPSEEYMKVQEPVEKLSKRFGEKKELDEEELQEAIKDLVKYFEESELKNPYELALKLLMAAVGFENSSGLFPPILRALDLVLRGEDAKDNGPSAELQGAAFVLSRVAELSSCADELANLFDLKAPAGDKLKSLIGELLKYHMYQQALNEIVENDLEKEFTVEEVVVPLVIQHYIGPVEELLKKSQHYLEPLIRYLDKIVGLTYSEMIAEVEKYEVPFVMGLGRQFLVRIILSWHGQFNFSLEWCPNIKLFFAKTQLYYLNRRRFRVVDLPYINWLELTLDLVEDSKNLAPALVDELVRYNASAEAKYWAGRLDVKKEDMAQPVIDALESVTEEFDIEKAKEEKLKPKEGKLIYELDLKDDMIQFVDQEGECNGILDAIATKGKVGIDVEWKPDTGVTPNLVSVLQLATDERVYIFDVKALKQGDTLVEGLNKLLLNENLVKVGFNVGRDIGFLERSLGKDLKFKESVHVVDLRVLQDKFYGGKVDFLFPNANRRDFKRRVYNSYEMRQVRGLNSLVKASFGKGLDRVELISNWDSRPLRQSQLRFAATDALILLKVYDQVSEEAKKNEKDLEELLKPSPPEQREGRRRDSKSGGDGDNEGGTDSGGEKTGEDSGRSSRNEDGGGDRRRYERNSSSFSGGYRGGRYGGFGGGRGRGGRFRGGPRGRYSYRGSRPSRPRPEGEREYPPAHQKEEILDNGKIPDIMSSPKKPKELKVVTDSMLHGLGKALMAKGLDVVVLRREDRHTDCVDRCKNEKRVILTQGRIFYEIKDQVSPGYCFKVVNRTVPDQVEEVLKAYQVQVDPNAEGENQNGVGEVSA